MRAKEYAAQYQRAVGDGKAPIDALSDTLRLLTREMIDLVKGRGARSDSAALACFKEIETKYHAFARLVSTKDTIVLPGGFRKYVETCAPELWNAIRFDMTMEEKRRAGSIHAIKGDNL